MFRHSLSRDAGSPDPRRDEATAAELQVVVAAALERARRGEVALLAALPLRRRSVPFQRPRPLAPVPMAVPSSPRDPMAGHWTFVAVWCHRVERLGVRILAYGTDAQGELVRWIDEHDRLGWLEDELALRGEPVPVTVGRWQIA